MPLTRSAGDGIASPSRGWPVDRLGSVAIAFKYLVWDDQKRVTKIAGRRIRVYDVLGYATYGDSPQEIAEDYRLPLAAVYEALAYAEEHPEEMAELEARQNEAYKKTWEHVPPELRAMVKA